MAEQRPGQAERDRRHHHQRPAVGGEHPRQHQVDQRQREQPPATHVGKGLALVRLAPLEIELDPVACLEPRQHRVAQRAAGGVGTGDRGIHVAGHQRGKLALGVAQRFESAPGTHLDRAEQWNGATARHHDREVVEARQPVALAVR